MKNFTKIVCIGTQPEFYKGNAKYPAKVFCKIKYLDKKLSITGVIGPLKNGNAIGSCGQIKDDINPRLFSKGWGERELKKFLSIWDEWHLNDMRATTPEMKKAGWDILAKKEIFKYRYTLKTEARNRQEQLKRELINAAINGQIVSLSEEDKRLLLASPSLCIWAYEEPECPEFMELHTNVLTKKPDIEQTTLGWVNFSEHPDGLLGRELNGKKYGAAWYFEEVPETVLEWLKALPETKETPNWI